MLQGWKAAVSSPTGYDTAHWRLLTVLILLAVRQKNTQLRSLDTQVTKNAVAVFRHSKLSHSRIEIRNFENFNSGTDFEKAKPACGRQLISSAASPAHVPFRESIRVLKRHHEDHVRHAAGVGCGRGAGTDSTSTAR